MLFSWPVLPLLLLLTSRRIFFGLEAFALLYCFSTLHHAECFRFAISASPLAIPSIKSQYVASPSLRSTGLSEAYSGESKDLKSTILSQLNERGLLAQAPRLFKLDEFLHGYELGAHQGATPAVYCGVDLTSNFIHEGTLVQFVLLRRFLSHGFNAVVVLGGATSLVGDPSFRNTKRKADTVYEYSNDSKYNVVLDASVKTLRVLDANEISIDTLSRTILGAPLDDMPARALSSGHPISAKIWDASTLEPQDLEHIKNTSMNLVFVNNRDLYDKVTLGQYLETVAKNLSLGRMLSRECIKSRFTQTPSVFETTMDDIDAELDGKVTGTTSTANRTNVNMDLAELLYMSLQALDFVHVASKYNARLQIGGSDQMGNIACGIELADKLNGTLYGQLYALTTRLVSHTDGTKVGKSAPGQLQLKHNTRALETWCHFRSVDDALCRPLLQWLTNVPLEDIDATLKRHVNDGKIMLANKMVALVHGHEASIAIQDFWLTEEYKSFLESSNQPLEPSQYSALINFLGALPQTCITPWQLAEGIDLVKLLNMVRVPPSQQAFFGNSRAIRQGTCKIGNVCIRDPKYKVTAKDLVTQSSSEGETCSYIPLVYGQRKVYLVMVNAG